MHLFISFAALLSKTDIVPVKRQGFLIVPMGGQIESQLVNCKVQCHQFGEMGVCCRKTGFQLSMKRQIKAWKQRTALQRLAVIIAFRVVFLHGDKGEGHSGTGPW